MQIAVFSDIHGNAVALDAVLANLQAHSPDQLVCLGDAIQGGPQPEAVVHKLRALGCPVVMGNADAWLLTGVETGAEPSTPERRRQLAEVRAWSLSQLGPDDQAFIAAFRPTVEIALSAGQRLLAFHGSPASFDEILLPETPEADFQRALGPHGPAFMAGGHTHRQQIRRIGDQFFFNPGSVGLAYSHHQPADQFRADPWAEYALLTITQTGVSLEFQRVPFDVAALRRAYAESGRPYAAEALAQYAER